MPPRQRPGDMARAPEEDLVCLRGLLAGVCIDRSVDSEQTRGMDVLRVSSRQLNRCPKCATTSKGPGPEGSRWEETPLGIEDDSGEPGEDRGQRSATTFTAVLGNRILTRTMVSELSPGEDIVSFWQQLKIGEKGVWILTLRTFREA
ncbi:hypothetical protein NM208_g13510 [Fusarium decemcellulare]|uniref:Uncharacterized protein n=1 Tax=Fusarium decemcellulare TaxID=57161 RepID=A0ACC1RNV9_9HYPO|nr:hypothetical protein NM208_g13510 [Fusarium decemcellulare]